MVRHRHCAPGSLGLPYTPVLVEGGCPRDAGLVDALGTVDVVRGPVRHNRSEESRPRAGVICPEVLDDVVLDQRAGGPAIDGEVRVAVWRVGT